MGWMGRGLEELRFTGEPVIELDNGTAYDGPHVRHVTIACEVATLPTATPEAHCNHEHFTLYGWADKPTRVSDRRIELAPTALLIHRRRLHCKRCDTLILERMPGVEIEHRITRRLYDDVFHAAVNRPFEDVARLHGVSPGLIQTIFRERARDLLGDYRPELPEAIAIDETMIAGQQRFVCNDLLTRSLVEILPDRSHAAISAFFQRQGSQKRVQVVVQDMNGGYRTLVREAFPDAMIVIDRFHVAEALNRAMNAARSAAMRAIKGDDVERKGLRKLGPLFLKNRRDLTRHELGELKGVLRAHPELKRAWMLKEELKRLYRFGSPERAAEHLDRIDARYDRRWTPVMKPMGAVIKMIREYEAEILNWHRCFQDNSFTEAMNHRYQLIDAARSGLRFETMRAKALLRYSGILDPWYLERL